MITSEQLSEKIKNRLRFLAALEDREYNRYDSLVGKDKFSKEREVAFSNLKSYRISMSELRFVLSMIEQP